MFLKINRQDITKNGKLLYTSVKVNNSLKLKDVDGGQRCYHLVSFACCKDEHWTSFFKNEYDKWFKCDDLMKEPVIPMQLTQQLRGQLNRTASLLLYELQQVSISQDSNPLSASDGDSSTFSEGVDTKASRCR